MKSMLAMFLLLSLGHGWAQTHPEASANLPAQRIGPNDLIAVSVYDSPELTRTVRVGADGLIRLPMLKQRIQAEGLLPAGTGGGHRRGVERRAAAGRAGGDA